MSKEKYEAPMMEIIQFETEDIITASGGDDDLIFSDPFTGLVQ